MIYLLGDTHGNFDRLKRYAQFLDPSDIVIQVGDFGVSRHALHIFEQIHFPDGFPCKLLFIDGNHENFTYLYDFPVDKNTGLRQITYNVYHVPRGHVMEIEGNLFGFLGGGESIDKAFRNEGLSWWPEERVTDEDVDRLISNVGNRQLDYLITHSCTDSFRMRHFSPLNFSHWKLPDGWEDRSMLRLERAYRKLWPHMHIFGHMHRAIKEPSSILLNIDELIELPPLREKRT